MNRLEFIFENIPSFYLMILSLINHHHQHIGNFLQSPVEYEYIAWLIDLCYYCSHALIPELTFKLIMIMLIEVFKLTTRLIYQMSPYQKKETFKYFIYQICSGCNLSHLKLFNLISNRDIFFSLLCFILWPFFYFAY